MHRIRPIHRYIAICALLALTAMAAAAQTETPVPTAVPTDIVGLTIDTNTIFTSANTWIGNLTPVYSIGIGIAVAFAILGFVGFQIIKAFRNNGAR